MIADLIQQAGPRALTPDVPEEERRRLAKNERFRKASEHCARLRHVSMIQRQTALARQNQSFEHKTVDGLGQHVASIDAETYFQARAKFGEGCWNDPGFVKAWLRDNPAARVNTTRGTRGQELRK